MASIDHFALLNQPRQPWVDPKELQANFVARSGAIHPDRIHNAPAEEKAAATMQFADLNTAYQCLRDPKTRVRHLLELEHGTKVDPLERIPTASVDEYFQLGQLCRDVDGFLALKATAVSPLQKVEFFRKGEEWRERLEANSTRLQQKVSALEQELAELNAAWNAAPAVGNPDRTAALPLARLHDIYRSLSFATRWAGQIRERLVQLSF